MASKLALLPSRSAALALPFALVLASPEEGRAQATEQSSLFCPHVTSSNFWGEACAVDGDWMVVGASGDSSLKPLRNHGVATIEKRDPATGLFGHHQTLYASDYSSWDAFGSAVAIDGDVVAVASMWNQVGTVPAAGSVYLFRLDPVTGTYYEEQRVNAPTPQVSEYFGRSLALVGDVLLIGAMSTFESASSTAPGSAYVFRHDDVSGAWNFEAQLFDDDRTHGAWFGISVAFDGTTAVVGASSSTENSIVAAGSANLFTVSGTTWAQVGEMIAPLPPNGAAFGQSLAIDDARLAVGAPSETTGAGSWIGVAYVHVKHPTLGTWSLEQKLELPSLYANSRFSTGLAMRDGILLVGAHRDSSGGGHVGSAWTWRLGKKAGGPWHLESELRASDASTAGDFGFVTCIGDAELVVTARYADTASGTDTGEVYFWDRDELTLSISPTNPAPDAPIDFLAYRGAPGEPVLLVAEAIDGVPLWLPLLIDLFAADYTWTLQANAPNPAVGVTVSLRVWKPTSAGGLVGSELIDLDL
jgi:hypothetical protein